MMAKPLGQLRTVMLNVNDMDKGCKFYSSVLGLPLKFRQGQEWAAFDAGGITIALAGGNQKADSSVSLNFKVADVQIALDQVVAGGGTLISRPRAGGHEILGAARDVDGHQLNFYSPK